MKRMFFVILLLILPTEGMGHTGPVPISADWDWYPASMYEIWNRAKKHRGTMFEVTKVDLAGGEHALVYHFQILDRRIQIWRCEERFSANMETLGSRCFRMREMGN